MQEGVIIKGVGGSYEVDLNDSQRIVIAKPRGIFRKKEIAISPMVGDMVSVSLLDDGSAVIEKIHERKSQLVRPKVANVGQALVVFAYKEPDLHLDLLDRFIINCEAANVRTIIAFNKVDLLDEKNRDEARTIKEMYEKIGYKVIDISTYKNTGIDSAQEALIGETTVFAGPSGAGKSSIFNAVCGAEHMEVGELSAKISRGKHTTRHSQLIKLQKDSYIVDSPGFSSIHLEGIELGELKELFREFEEPSGECKFADCNHIDEPGCGVKQGVLDGVIYEERYKRYLSFTEELRVTEANKY